MTKIRISRFNMETMQPHCTILIVGKRRSGKSTLLRDILYHLRNKVDIPFAMTPTYETTAMFEGCMPSSHVFNDYNLEQVMNILNNLKALKEEKKERSTLLVLDDCMYDKKIMRSVEMRKIHMNGRHFNLYFINCVQYLMDIPSEIRSQIDYVFAFKDSIRKNREKLFNYFFGMFSTFRDFELVFSQCTNNYECLVLDASQCDNDISKGIHYYKANINIPSFTIGRSIYFKLDKFYKRQMQNRVGRGNALNRIQDNTKSKEGASKSTGKRKVKLPQSIQTSNCNFDTVEKV